MKSHLIYIFQAYLHERFRHKTAEFLKVLNRAKPLSQEKVVTIDGRTFALDRKNESWTVRAQFYFCVLFNYLSVTCYLFIGLFFQLNIRY